MGTQTLADAPLVALEALVSHNLSTAEKYPRKTSSVVTLKSWSHADPYQQVTNLNYDLLNIMNQVRNYYIMKIKFRITI